MLRPLAILCMPLSCGKLIANYYKDKKEQPEIVLVESRLPSSGPTYTPSSIPPYVRSTYGGKGKGKK